MWQNNEQARGGVVFVFSSTLPLLIGGGLWYKDRQRGGVLFINCTNTDFDRPACKPITSLPVSASLGIRDRAPDPKYYFSTRLLLLRVYGGRHGVCFSTPVCKFLAYTMNAWYQFYQFIKLFTLNTKNTIFFKYDPHYRVHTSKWYARNVFREGVVKIC